ncbi:5609_t:CDS:10 [Funneliformis geosporum]|nr:5609_t:CDS:10 [Funneliformis geosporum]
MSSPHEYFKKRASDWNITGFLNVCELESFQQIIECYLTSLDSIIKTESGHKREKAQILYDKYKKAGLRVEPQTGAGAQGLRPDRELARKWDDDRARKQVHIHEPTYFDYGFIHGSVQTINGTITGGTFATGSSKSERDREKDLNNETENFFLSPSERQSSNLFGEVKHDVSNESDNEEGEIVHRIEKHKRDEPSRCLNCDADLNNFSSIIFCPYCGTKIVSSEDDESSLDYDETDEENVVDDVDEDEDTPPKVDKVAFWMAYDAIPETSKLRLSSTDRIVEDILFEFAKDMDYEHHAHSYIVDFDDEDIKALFDEEEWKELTKDKIGVPSIPCDIAKELAKYGKKREEYDVNKHHGQEWIQMAMRTLCNLYGNVDAPLIRSQYEDWFTVALFGTCIDFCIRELGTDIKRADAPSLSSANRKNRGRKANTRTRKLISHKIDGIIHIVDKPLEVGAIEGARSYSGVSDQKYLLETFKMPKTLRDMYAELMRALDYDDQKANKIQVIGILHLGKFSEMGVISFLKLLVSIYQHKIIIKDNLQILNIWNNNANIKSGDDLLNELLEFGQSSSSYSVSSPPRSVKFFSDSFKTPRKQRKTNPVKKRKLK